MTTSQQLISSDEIKRAQTTYPVSPAIRNRWSSRAFQDTPIAPDTLSLLLEAASWTASSMNEQPWHYVYAHRTDTEAFAKMVDCLSSGNQPWARNAAILMLSIVRTHFAANGKPNRHAFYDVGAANTTMLLQAAEIGILGHQMGGFDIELAKSVFEIPDGYEPAVFIALGYVADPDTLDEPFRTRELTPRNRMPLSSFSNHKSLVF